MQYLEKLSSIDIDLKYMVLFFNFVTILILVVYRRMNPTTSPQSHNILFVTAHPDDESMFFQPTIKSLAPIHTLHLLCLSGSQQRRKQLHKACQRLKIAHVKCVHHDHLRDGMKEKWDQQVISGTVLDYIRQHKIKAVITFDAKGISGHPNHQAINSSLKSLVVKEKTQQTIKLYQLTSINVVRKYSSILDFPVSLLAPFLFVNLNVLSQFVTMAQHQSQFVWYRKLSMLFSRYSLLNTYDTPKWISV